MRGGSDTVSVPRSRRSSRNAAATLEGAVLRVLWTARSHVSAVKRFLFIAAFVILAWVGLFRSPSQAPVPAPDQPVATATTAPAPDPAPERPRTLPDISNFPPVDFEALRMRFGSADAETTTAWDDPRPLFVTRTMTFNKHRLKLVMMAEAEAGAPPPYKRWLLTGLFDPVTNEALSPAEIEKRLSSQPKPDRTTQGVRSPSAQR